MKLFAEIAEMRASHATTIVNAAGSSKTGDILMSPEILHDNGYCIY